MKFDDFFNEYISDFGIRQKIQFVLVVLPTLFCALHGLSWTFTAPNLVHRCKLPAEVSPYVYNIGENALLSGCDEKNSSTCSYDGCTYANGTTCTDGHVFVTNGRYTAVERWDLVCSKHIYKPIVQSAYYLGQFLGSFVFGFLGDRYGRKKVFLVAILVQCVSGFGMAWSPSIEMFAFFRGGAGFAHPGIFMTAVILGMELMTPSYRSLASVFSGAFFSFGQVVLGLLAYFISDYRNLQLSISFPAFVFLSYIWLIPESIRWLISQQKFHEADKVLQKMASRKGLTVPKNWWNQLDADANGKSTQKKRNFFDLFKTPNIRLRAMVMFFCWPVVSMAYYGMAMKPDLLGSDMYLNFIAGGIVEIPASVFMFLTVDRFGRKPLLIGSLLTTGFTLLSNIVVDESTHSAIPIVQYLLSKASLTLTYSTIYAFTPELFPTEIRNMAVGACSMIARFGASSSSFLVMYLVEIYGRKVITIPFGSLVIAAALLIFLTLPETAGASLPETISDLEKPKVEANKNDEGTTIPLVPIVSE